MNRYLYIMAIRDVDDFDPARFVHTFVEAEDEHMAYDEGYNKIEESGEGLGEFEMMINDYVVELGSAHDLGYYNWSNDLQQYVSNSF